MLKSYIIIALRNLRKDRVYSFINIFGLAVGIASCLLIMLFVSHERSFDRFHEKSDRIYRAWGKEDYGEGRTFFYTMTPIPLGPTLAESIPEVEAFVRVDPYSNLVGRTPNRFTEQMHFVDPDFFSVFDFKLLHGDSKTALAQPGRVVLTPEIAEKYFPESDPMGAVLPIEIDGNVIEFIVSGVAEPPPAASSIQYDMLLPYENAMAIYSPNAQQSWFNISAETYVLLGAGADVSAVETKLPDMIRTVMGDDYKEDAYIVGLQPITDIHLNQDFPVGIEPTSDPAYSFILGAAALLVLLIASINFVMLSIGQSTRRAREVGLRKVLGAPRRQVMQQFWSEAAVLVMFSVLLGLAAAYVALPAFNDLAGRDLVLDFGGGTAAFLLVIILLIGFAAGSYPALVLSRFQPAAVLKSRLVLAGERGLLRRALVVVQFMLAIFLITGTLFVDEQLRYLQNKNLGFEKDHVVIIPTGVSGERGMPIAERFREEVQAYPDVTATAASAFALDESWLTAGYEATDGSWRTFNMNWTTPRYLETMGMRMLAGRPFSDDFASDSAKIIVNEALVRDYGWASPDAALGKSLPGNDFPEHEIVGVVQDFHFASLREEIAPLVFTLAPNRVLKGVSDVSLGTSPNPKLAVRIQTPDVRTTIALLERSFQKVASGLPFDYYFLDEAVDAQYRDDQRLARIVGAAAVLAIVIACLGIFGLATLSVARRTKEIGVRKTMGASATGIAVLLSKDFLRLVIVGFVLAAPLTYVAVDRWLEDFAYRIDVEIHTFLLAGTLAVLIALATVSYHAVRGAKLNPVESLRYE